MALKAFVPLTHINAICSKIRQRLGLQDTYKIKSGDIPALIDEIKPDVKVIQNTASLQTCYIDEWEIPTKSADGTDMPTSLKILGKQGHTDNLGLFVANNVKKVIIPSYFVGGVVDRARELYNRIIVEQNGYLQEIEDYAQSLGAGTTQYICTLNRNTVNKITSTYPEICQIGIYMGAVNNETLDISLPNAKRVDIAFEYWNSTGMRTVNLDAPSALYACKTGGKDWGSARLNGEFSAKAATKMGEWDIPMSGTTKWYLDEVEEFDSDAAYFHGLDGHSDGVLHWYLGEHLLSMTDNFKTRSINYAQWVKFHIPPGINTTRLTLDAAGISYTQDYMPGVTEE